MAIKQNVPDPTNPPHTKVVTVSDRRYHATHGGLAQLIVNAWANPGKLLDRDAHGNPTPEAVQEATREVNARGGFNPPWQRAVVITEAEYNNDYTLQQDERVFVLPKDPGSRGPGLLNKARDLMRHTPNGI